MNRHKLPTYLDGQECLCDVWCLPLMSERRLHKEERKGKLFPQLAEWCTTTTTVAAQSLTYDSGGKPKSKKGNCKVTLQFSVTVGEHFYELTLFLCLQHAYTLKNKNCYYYFFRHRRRFKLINGKLPLFVFYHTLESALCLTPYRLDVYVP